MLANPCIYVFDVATRAIARTDRLTPDDIGLLPVGEDAAEAFYRIIDAAYERRSIAVTSNIHPPGFDTIMPKTLVGASTDRLMRQAHLVTTTGDSHRLAEALAGKGVVALDLPPSPGTPLATPGFLMAASLDTQRPPTWASQRPLTIRGARCRDQGSVHGQWWIDDSRAGIVTGLDVPSPMPYCGPRPDWLRERLGGRTEPRYQDRLDTREGCAVKPAQ
ncbi:hypothetical protein GCM10010350_78350 [Streptomyces galilaeus]|nr:ATP-binding protein [Streptomyces galilaeus]GGW81943.1 hypothetical protein GCM10010350_78350 [Streptomyces galilaeus]